MEHTEDPNDGEILNPSGEYAEDSDDGERADSMDEYYEDSDGEETTGPVGETSADSEDGETTGPPEGHQMLDLLMPMFSGGKDEFGKELVPPLPLLFDRVSEGKRPVSRTKLFQVPLEVLALIAQKVPEASLASLALVNSDCRQLARSRQFASLHFDYGDDTLAIINKLQAEMTERSNHNGTTCKPALGPCIRRLTIATHPGWVTHRHDIELSDAFTALPKRVQIKRMNAAYNAFFGSYIKSIEDLLFDRTVLPHLELLDWEDMLTLQPSFFDAIAHSTVQHCKIFRVQVDKVFTINPPQFQPSRSWPLRSLYLEIGPTIQKKDMDVSSLCTSILNICAPSLESLTWKTVFPRYIFHTDRLGPSPRFPSLRHLRLKYLKFADDCYLQELVHDGLSSLDVGMYPSSACSEFFDRRGRIPALKVFVWDSYNLPESQSLKFLEANPQISKLSIPMEAPLTLLEDRILPLLVQSFSNLTSLSLVWAGLKISSQAMHSVCQITTLQQLHLSAGFQAGWRHDWLIDHQVMRKYLRKLPLLKKLAFSRDSYDDGTLTSCDGYYSSGWRSIEDVDEDGAREIFEEVHQWRILGEADSYVDRMPQLEWLYFGQIPMAVEQCLERGARVAKPLTTERDNCWTLLREMFGWKGLLPS